MTKASLLELFDSHAGKVSDKWSSYLKAYDRLFGLYRDGPVRMLEIGVQNGGSLEIWAKYFSNAQVLLGCDINPDCEQLRFDDPRIHLIVGDANSQDVRAKIAALTTNFDIVIDDGSHFSDDIVKSFANYFPQIADGGLYIAEDLHCSYWSQYQGGLFHPRSSIAFFKKLADIVNHEHWGITTGRFEFIQELFPNTDMAFRNALTHIHSVEFANSLCIVRKAEPRENELGIHVVAGQHQVVMPGRLELAGVAYSFDPNFDQTGNPWSHSSTDDLLHHAISSLDKAQERIRDLQHLEGMVGALQRQSDGLKLQLDTLQSSTSWRYTAPLRRMYANPRLRRALRTLRRKVFRPTLTPVIDLERDGGSDAWQAVGSEPQFLLAFADNRHPAGWVHLRARIRFDQKIESFPSIYVDSGSGFSEADRIRLPRMGVDGIDEIIRLPDRVIALRFHPMEQTGRFQLNEIILTEVGVTELGLRLAARYARQRFAGGDAAAGMQPILPELRRRGFDGLRTVLIQETRPERANNTYAEWIRKHDQSDAISLKALKVEADGLAFRPKFSIVMPTFNTADEWLRRAIDTVRDQVYDNWELCICDDASTLGHVRRRLEKYSELDKRIKVAYRSSNGHIARSTNDAMALASGDYMCLMDHDDEIPPDALLEFAKALNENRDLDFIYSDEDKMDMKGKRFDPFFKPDWSPEYLESCMYTAHFACYRMDIVREIGGFRSECNGAQDYDFVLRYTEHVNAVRHIRKVLYHWRAIPGSTAQSMENKSYVIAAAVRALEDRLKRTGELDWVRPGSYKGCFDVRRKVAGAPKVSIVIPSAGRDSVVDGKNVDLLARCVEGIHAKSTYRNFEIVVVDNGDLRRSTVKRLGPFGIKFVTFKDPVFNVAKKMNIGAAAATSEFLIFLNDDTDVISPDWIEALLSVVQRPGVGAAGAKLLFEDGALQHVGVTFSDSLPDHIRRGYPRNDPGYFFSSVATKTYMAVTGACIMVPAALFRSVGCFDEALAINYNDIDLCLKLVQAGHRVVYTPQAELFHYESRNRERTVDPKEIEYFLARWKDFAARDPFYGDNFRTKPPTYELDFTR